MYTTEEFDKAQEIYLNTHDTKSWDKMFLCVMKCCEVQTRKIMGNKGGDILDYSMQATVNIMNRYKKPKGYKIDYLVTVCRNECFSLTQKAKEKFYRSILSLDFDKTN